MKYKLGHILAEFKELNSQSLYIPVAVGKYGIRKRSEIYKKELSADYSKNKIIRINTLVIGMGSNQIDMGVLVEDSIYSVSPAYHTYKIDTNIVNSLWLDYLLKAKNQYYFSKYAVHSARQGKTMDLDGLFNEEIDVPSIEEQIMITEKLSCIKTNINREEKTSLMFNELIKSRFIGQEMQVCC